MTDATKGAILHLVPRIEQRKAEREQAEKQEAEELQREVIEQLANLLKLAKAGEVDRVVYVAGCTDGSIVNGATALFWENGVQLIGCLEYMKAEVMETLLAISDNVPLSEEELRNVGELWEDSEDSEEPAGEQLELPFEAPAESVPEPESAPESEPEPAAEPTELEIAERAERLLRAITGGKEVS